MSITATRPGKVTALTYVRTAIYYVHIALATLAIGSWGLVFQALPHGLHIGFGMGEPGGREGAEIRVVVREQRFAPGVVFGLHQPAVRAHQHAQREPDLGRAQGGLAQVGVGRRGAAQV